MTGDSGSFEYVFGSAARREVLSVLEAGPERRPAVVETADASQSSVYAALNELRDRGLVTEADAEWRLTGAGQTVVRQLSRCRSVDAVLRADPDYWRGHDAGALPDRFRAELDALEGYEVLRSPDTDPFRATRRIEETIEAGSVIDIATPIYHDRYADAFLETHAERKRLLMTPETVRSIVTEIDGDEGGPPAGSEAGALPGAEMRITDSPVALTVTDSSLLLSLPELDGSYDRHTELLVSSDAAVDWGRRLFETLWTAATPVEAFVDRADVGE